jgi:DNA/RNA endonuclease YhcR with UshA esterase domain
MRSKWDEQRGDQTYGELTIDEAIRIVDTYDPHLHGMDAAAPEAEIARLEPEQNATIEATVTSVESVSTDAIEQTGELEDETGQIRFVVWASEYWDPDVEFTEGATYRVADAWVTEYNGQRQVQINEHTAIEEQ